MVELLDARGCFSREVLKQIPHDGRRRREIYFDLSKADGYRKQSQVLAELAKYPEYDADSYLITNSTTATGSRITDVLSVPFDTPDLMPHKHTEFREGETYLVDAWDAKRPMRRARVPVLANSLETSITAARRRASDILGINKRQLCFQSEQVSLEELLEHCKQILLNDGHLPYHIMRLGDLQEFVSNLERRSLKDQFSLPKAS